mgnify:CR=1 FL=1
MIYKKRHIEETITHTEKGFKAVLLTGPRQVGKSTLLKNIHKDRSYITFDNPVLLEETKREPGLFFKNNRPPIILDEVQYITDLFPYIKMECDNIEDNGLINMTGSQQFQLMKNVSESLAGRIAILELAGLSLRELMNDSFNRPFIPGEEYIEERRKTVSLCDDLWKIIHRGSYPGLLDSNVDWEIFYSSYVQTYIDRDVNDITGVKDRLKFVAFMSAMAARTGQMINYSTIAEQVGVTVATIKEWTSILEASGNIYILQPYSNSALTRAIKTPKLYFRDTGLVCYLTKHQTPETALNGAMAGELFETFVVSEILKSFSNAGKDYRMYVSYYRGKDKGKNEAAKESEIDLIIEEGEILYPVEIKMSANPRLSMTDAFDVLNRIPEKKRGTGVVICRYDNPLWLNERNVVLPVEYI